jgi:hypothetical protein
MPFDYNSRKKSKAEISDDRARRMVKNKKDKIARLQKRTLRYKQISTLEADCSWAEDAVRYFFIGLSTMGFIVGDIMAFTHVHGNQLNGFGWLVMVCCTLVLILYGPMYGWMLYWVEWRRKIMTATEKAKKEAGEI